MMQDETVIICSRNRNIGISAPLSSLRWSKRLTSDRMLVMVHVDDTQLRALRDSIDAVLSTSNPNPSSIPAFDEDPTEPPLDIPEWMLSTGDSSECDSPSDLPSD